eukprot:m.265486 g.265486  ORF g.265486 m.265486 type:complete len:50 (-) comp62003_c0_seq1:5-154(-)
MLLDQYYFNAGKHPLKTNERTNKLRYMYTRINSKLEEHPTIIQPINTVL